VTAEKVRQVPVVVVGAGPTGVTVATLLGQYGIDCLVLDRWGGVYPQPRAVHMDDEIYRIVARLGIADEFAAISRPTLGLRLLDERMTVLTEFKRDITLGRNGFPQANMFDQPDFEALLRVNLKRCPRAELRGNAEVTDIAEDDRGRVRVTYADRIDGSRHVVEADYVLGCDGANSVVRSRIGATMTDLNFEQRWLVVDVATTADLVQWEGVHQVCDPVRAGTYMRIGDSRYRWEFQLLAGETAADFNTLDALRPLIEPWVQQVPAERLDLVRVAEYTFRAQLADRWRRGNVFLLGDAAHLTPPFVGQGMGAGLRDGMNLAWKLAGVLGASWPAEILDSYEVERKPHARHMIHLALGVGRAMTSGGDVGNLIRRVIVPRLRWVPGLRDKIVDSETPALRRSALIHRSRTPRQLAGTLCPNPEVAGGTRLDDVLGTGFAVVSTVLPTAAVSARIVESGAVLHTVASDSELAQWLRRGRATAAIIRPDRTVMRSGRHLGELCDALPQNRVPTYRPDIYRTAAIVDPYPHYTRLRELGPVVWLPRQRVYALSRYAECKAVLRDDETFISGHGVGLNPIVNRLSRGTTLNSDGAEHDQRRKLVAHRMLPRALRAISDDVDALAAAVVDAALARGEVDGVADVAAALPLAVVPDLVGWPRDRRADLLAWGGATFDFLGPLNGQALRAVPGSIQMLRFADRVVRKRSMLDGSLGHDVLVAADNGAVSPAECKALMIDYIAPSLDTTISAIANALHLFATHPDQWQALRDDPALIPNAVNEVIRYESPLRAFTRQARVDTEIAGVPMVAGARVLVIYASANRDEREWDDPDVFDVRRDANRQLGFGQGAHACAGQGLARLETTAMLRALVERVARIELVGPGTWAINNIIRRHEHLPIKLVGA
jgi:3-(3-hydroxy-phenyl)propionate hydroxylase